MVSSCGKQCFRLAEKSLQQKRLSRLSCHSVKVSCARLASAWVPASHQGKIPGRSPSGAWPTVAEKGKARAMRALAPSLEHGDLTVQSEVLVSVVKHQTRKHQTDGRGRWCAGRLRQRQALTCHLTVDTNAPAAKKHSGRSLTNRRNSDGPVFLTFKTTAAKSCSSGLRTAPRMQSILRFSEVSRRGPTGLRKERYPCRS